MWGTRLALLASLAAVLAGCVDQGIACHRLAGSYCLQQWEDNATYYLYDRASGANNDGGGAIEGTVQRVAWTRDLILVERMAVFRGDPDGWMLIDVTEKTVRGPIAESEAQAIFAREGLRPESASAAWQRLRW